MVYEHHNGQASMRERPAPSGALSLVSASSTHANLSAELSIGGSDGISTERKLYDYHSAGE